MTWRVNKKRTRKRATRVADIGSTPIVRTIGSANIAQKDASRIVQAQVLGERPHSPKYPIPNKTEVIIYNFPHRPLCTALRFEVTQ